MAFACNIAARHAKSKWRAQRHNIMLVAWQATKRRLLRCGRALQTNFLLFYFVHCASPRQFCCAMVAHHARVTGVAECHVNIKIKKLSWHSTMCASVGMALRHASACLPWRPATMGVVLSWRNATPIRWFGPPDQILVIWDGPFGLVSSVLSPRLQPCIRVVIVLSRFLKVPMENSMDKIIDLLKPRHLRPHSNMCSTMEKQVLSTHWSKSYSPNCVCITFSIYMICSADVWCTPHSIIYTTAKISSKCKDGHMGLRVSEQGRKSSSLAIYTVLAAIQRTTMSLCGLVVAKCSQIVS